MLSTLTYITVSVSSTGTAEWDLLIGVQVDKCKEEKETKKGRKRRQKGEQYQEGREEGQVSRLITVLKKSPEVCT